MLPQGLPPLSGHTGFCITRQCAGREERQVAEEPEVGHAFRACLSCSPY